MSIPQAVALGLAGEAISKKITGSSEVSAARTAVATTAGMSLGYVATGALVVGGLTAASPIVVPLAFASGAVAFVRSLFD